MSRTSAPAARLTAAQAARKAGCPRVRGTAPDPGATKAVTKRGRQADEHRATLERLGREQAAALAERARQVSAAEGELERLHHRVRDGLTRLARAAPIAPTEFGQQQEEDLVQQLRRAVTAQVDCATVSRTSPATSNSTNQSVLPAPRSEKRTV